MELDELKKSWNVLDAQLQKEPIADEERIKELIAGYKANTRVSMGCILNSQRFSLDHRCRCYSACYCRCHHFPTQYRGKREMD